jgi:hypothetical protein
MLVKLKNNLINLDLVKEVSTDIFVHLVHPDDAEEYVHVLTNKEDIERWEENTKNGSERQKEYFLMYGFKMWYLNEKYAKTIKVSKDKEETERARVALVTLLNGNNPVIHEIKF